MRLPPLSAPASARRVQLVVVLAFLISPSFVRASWVEIPVTQAAGAQYVPRAVADGSGGALVAYFDGSIRVQRVQSSDAVDPAWPSGGCVVGTAADPGIAIASDGAGGAIVAWSKGPDLDITAHHVLASGVLDPAWPSFGVAICTAPNIQLSVTMVSDGAGGVLLAWVDYRDGQSDIHAHHVLASGVVDPAWPANGLAVISDPQGQSSPVAVADGSGGMVVAWEDFRDANDYDVYAQRILASGAIAAGWPVGGRSLVANNDQQTSPIICSDGSGGAIVAWSDDRQGDADVFAMRVGASGSLSQGWQNGGEILCDASGNQEPFDLIADGAGGAVAAWYDGRAADGFKDIYVQRVTSGGVVAWTADGVGVCTAPGDQVSPSLGLDGTGAFLVAWQDQRTPPSTDLYMHRVLAAGSLDGAWPANGGRLTYGGTVRFGGNERQPLVHRGGGNATVFWAGNSGSGQDDVIAMHVSATPPPVLYTVTVGVAPPATGTVSRNPNLVAYASGTQVTLTASAAAGYVFSSWSGDAAGSANPVVLTVDGNESVTAHFVPQPPECGKWSPIESAMAPSARSLAPTVWDPVRQRVLLFGGFDGTNYLNDVWQFTVSQGWSQITTFATAPSPRNAAGLIYDPVRDRLLVVAGNHATTPLPNDVWALSLTGNPTWSQLTPAGTPPAGRFGFTTIYDPPRDRVLMFGGHLGGATTNQTNSVWELSLVGTPAWTQLAPGGSPPLARYSHVAIYDPVRDRMIVHGGLFRNNFNENFQEDTWALALAPSPVWAPLTPWGPAPRIARSAAVYDSLRDRMVLVAGAGLPGSGADEARVSSLSLEIHPGWIILAREGWPFEPRYFHSAVYQSSLDAILAFQGITLGGPGGGAPRADARRLDLGGGWWLQTGPVQAPSQARVDVFPRKNCYQEDEEVTLQAIGTSGYAFDHWIGDAGGTTPLIDVVMDSDKLILAMYDQGPVGVDDPTSEFALGEIAPNPSSGPVRIAYSLPRAASVRLGVFDVSGRLVARLVDGAREPGRHHATWDGIASGARPSAGIYFVRFDTPSGTWTRRLALLR